MIKILITLVLVLIVAATVSIRRESKEFNGGSCSKCGRRLALIKKDSYYREYFCHHCKRTIKVSWKVVDGEE